VVFTPAASGSRSASLVVTDNSNGVSNSTQTSTLTGTAAHDVILSWTASPGSGVVGYNVYRGTVSGGESSTALNSTPIADTSYVDANVTPGTTYYYVVRTVGSNGSQSAPSNETPALP
jgi:fibronectin type 3 domain-containing protein